MGNSEFEFDEPVGDAPDVAGTPEGDGDFETDALPSTGETSAGGQLDAGEAKPDKPVHKPSLLEHVLEEISSGKIIP